MADGAGLQERAERAAGEGPPVVAVVGAGITGLAAALRLRERLPGARVLVLEAGARPGGVLRTIHQDGFLIEESADSFLTALPHGLDLCRRVGLDEEIVPTSPDHRRAFVVRRGRLAPIPDGLMIMAPTRILPLLSTPILSPWGKLRMGLERFVRPGDGRDESLASFARRRFGREAYERLIQPLVGGMYTGDPERLSVQATMPRFQEMEQTHGSLIRAALRQRASAGAGAGAAAKAPPGASAGSGARYGMFVGLRRGMASLVAALERALPPGTIRCGADVQGLEASHGGRWRLRCAAAAPDEAIEADAVVLATPVRGVSRLLAGIDPELSARLGQINSTSCAIVSLAYRREQVAHPLDGFGFVVPRVEERRVLSGSFSSVKFPGRAPEGTVLFRAFLGGAFQPGVVDEDDAALRRLAADDLARLLGIRGGPFLCRISRWRSVMPQYEIGHRELVRHVETMLAHHRGLALAGNAYQGVGVPQCIQSGEQAADRVAQAIAQDAERRA